MTTSVWPLPAVCRDGGPDDWFTSVKQKLLWNQRTIQDKHSAHDGHPWQEGQP